MYLDALHLLSLETEWDVLNVRLEKLISVLKNHRCLESDTSVLNNSIIKWLLLVYIVVSGPLTRLQKHLPIKIRIRILLYIRIILNVCDLHEIVPCPKIQFLPFSCAYGVEPKCRRCRLHGRGRKHPRTSLSGLEAHVQRQCVFSRGPGHMMGIPLIGVCPIRCARERNRFDILVQKRHGRGYFARFLIPNHGWPVIFIGIILSSSFACQDGWWGCQDGWWVFEDTLSSIKTLYQDTLPRRHIKTS